VIVQVKQKGFGVFSTNMSLCFEKTLTTVTMADEKELVWIYQMVPFAMTASDLGFKVVILFNVK